MKTVLAVLAMVLLTAVSYAGGPLIDDSVHATATATATGTGGSGGQGGKGGDADVTIGGGFLSKTLSPEASASANQGQGQGQNQFGFVNVQIENPREYLAIPGIGVYVPSMVPGAVLDVTKMIFLPVGLKAMSGQESYVETISFNGWLANRIRLGDLSQDILKYYRELSGKWAEAAQIRIQVWMKGQTSGWGGSGGSSGGAGFPGSTAVSGGVMGVIGYNSSYQDPQYVVTFYRVPYAQK